MKTIECPSCAMDIDKKAKECPVCGYEFSQFGWGIKVTAIILVLLLLYIFLF